MLNPNKYTETTTRSWGDRILGSFLGAIIGIALFIGSFFLISWNEGSSVDRIKTLDEGRGAVIPVSSQRVSHENDGKLIHISGTLKTNNILKDELFGISEKALKLKRTVKMYQWKETRSSKTTNNLGGSETTETTYSYDKGWDESLIDSSKFKKRGGYKNPVEMPYRNGTLSANKVNIGSFKLGGTFLRKINSFKEYLISQENYDVMDYNLKHQFKVVNGEYISGDLTNPQIGDVRIKYSIVTPHDASIIGKQDRNTINEYHTKNGNISLLSTGVVSAESMFSSAESANTIKTWLMRVGAFFMMWIGLMMFLNPIKVLADVVPFIGWIFGAGITGITGLISLVLTFVTVAIAWIVFRPVIGIILLIIAGSAVYYGNNIFSKKPKIEKQEQSPTS